ncbi:hypothetical protein [Flavobacterium frigoris]|uniref:hypothetical protein n=1 Tax=Flavobacterium frigoris TaxID=229204 RepID=UPI00058D929B|nr:hypothetical protein [Flavobacterium frigoris]
MDYKIDITYEAPYYKLIQKKPIDSKEIYSKLINWVSGEFDVYLQDETSGLIIYYPNGSFSIDCNFQLNDEIIEFIVISKSKKSCFNMLVKVIFIYNNICQIYGFNNPITYELQ